MISQKILQPWVSIQYYFLNSLSGRTPSWFFFPWCLWGLQQHNSMPDKILWNGNWRETAAIQYSLQYCKMTGMNFAKLTNVWIFFPQINFKWEKNRENLELCCFRNLSEHNLKQLGCPFSYVQHDFQAQQLKSSSGETSQWTLPHLQWPS